MTLEEIATSLGVSKSTVSRALSGKGRIGEETRRRIVEFARQNQYIETTTEENNGKTGNISVVIPGDYNISVGPYFHEVILGINETAARYGYDVLLTCAVSNDINEIKNVVEKKKADGMIITRIAREDKAISYLLEKNFPVAITGTIDNNDIIQVDSDNESAASTMTSLLIGKGYRSFALILGDMNVRVNRSRYDGFFHAILNNHILLNRQYCYKNFLSFDMVDSVVEELISKKVECVICGDDMICTRFMSSLQSQGYRIPMDIAVASLYNSTSLDCFTPSITTVHASPRQIGNMVCRQLIQSLEGKEYSTKTVVDFELHIRKSTGTMEES